MISLDRLAKDRRDCALRAAMALTLCSGAVWPAQPAKAQTPSDAPIAVVVNQVPVSFRGAPPQEINNSVLVPLRGVFEQLGATVNYDPASRQIQAKKGVVLVVLTIGQTTAYVGGVPATLSQAAIVTPDGTTLVPLRFVAQAFGADVAWLPSSHTVVVNTPDAHVASLPAPPLDENGVATGMVTEVYPNTNPPSVSMRINGGVYSVPLSSDSVILVDRGSSRPAIQGDLTNLHGGDQIRVTEASSGAPASIVRVLLTRLTGTVKSIAEQPDGSAVIVLNDGQTRRVQSGAPVSMAGQPITLSDILPNERVVLHVDPDSGSVNSVDLPKGGGYSGEAPDGSASSGATGAAQISSFTVDAAPLLRSGDKLTATLRGTPGGSATFGIPGVAQSVPMTEVSPGVYRGTFQVPADANVQGGSVLGGLKTGDGGSQAAGPLLQAAQTVTIDNTPPKISGRSPAPNATLANNRPRIYAITQDGDGSGIDQQGTKVSVDGADVTASAIVTDGFVTYQPGEPLSDGSHTVEVVARDKAGNDAHSRWSFQVSAAPGVVSGFDSNLISSDAILLAGQPLNVTLHAQPGGAASFSVGSIAGDIPMRESSPGVYTGSYVPRAGISAANVPVEARYTSPNGTTISSTLPQSVSIDAGVPVAPTITQPTAGSPVGDTVVLKGHCAPNALVSVAVRFQAKQLGVFSVGGMAAQVQVTGDNNGHWSTDTLRLGSPGPLARANSVTYTASVTQSVSNGQQSPAATITFRHG